MPSAVQNSVRSAISNAEEVTKNYNSTMDALKDAKSQLEQASNDIQSYQDLVAKIEEAQQVYEGLADDAAHKDALNQAIQNAQTALNDPNATIVDFNHANDALDLNIKLAQASSVMRTRRSKLRNLQSLKQMHMTAELSTTATTLAALQAALGSNIPMSISPGTVRKK